MFIAKWQYLNILLNLFFRKQSAVCCRKTNTLRTCLNFGTSFWGTCCSMENGWFWNKWVNFTGPYLPFSLIHHNSIFSETAERFAFPHSPYVYGEEQRNLNIRWCRVTSPCPCHTFLWHQFENTLATSC